MSQISKLDKSQFLAREAIVQQVVSGPVDEIVLRARAVLDAAGALHNDSARYLKMPLSDLTADAQKVRKAFGATKMFDHVIEDSRAGLELLGAVVAAAVESGDSLRPGLDLNDVSDAVRGAVSSSLRSQAAEVDALLGAVGLPAGLGDAQMVALLPVEVQPIARFLSDGGTLADFRNVLGHPEHGLAALLGGIPGIAKQLDGASAMLDGAQLRFLSGMQKFETFGMMAQMVVGGVFSNPAAAKDIGSLVQAGVAIGQAYLMFSTGGLSVFATGSGALSAASVFQGLGGLGGDSGNAAFQAEMRALVADLRRDIAALKALDLRILAGIEEVLRGQAAIAEQLRSIASDVVHTFEYIRNSDRFVAVQQFERDTKPLLAIPPEEYGIDDINRLAEHLQYVLLHANKGSANPAFMGGGLDPPWRDILSAGRVDLCLDRLGHACVHLGLQPSSVDNNPNEWARGASAFAEAVVHWRPPHIEAIDGPLERCAAVGRKLKASLTKATRSANLKQAAARFHDAVYAVQIELETVIHSAATLGKKDLIHAWLGRRQVPILTQPTSLRDSRDLPAPVFVCERPNPNDTRNWKFVRAYYEQDGMPGEMLQHLINEGYVSLQDERRVNTVPFFPGSLAASGKEYTLRSRDGTLGTIRLWDVRGEGSRLDAWEVGAPWASDGRVSPGAIHAFFETLRLEANDRKQVRAGINKYFSEPSSALANYYETVACVSLLFSLAGWRKTGRLDNPDLAPALRAIPKPALAGEPYAELKQRFESLAEGISVGFLRRIEDVDGEPYIGKLKRAYADASPDAVIKWAEQETISYSHLLSILRQYWERSIAEGMQSVVEGLDEAGFALIDRTQLKLLALDRFWR